ncbi:hypothetical protein HYALB_00013041 [Hymenoscyphus albidus]|uniref:Uncharacterized protein n=1 Tax=Hymenoscyphus albidus TaxID=595503 RepID=A0A9N9Q8X8_9HELO|nr:hypothetical protein HYALB_00013041 [Hymenoscyphus albidus]
MATSICNAQSVLRPACRVPHNSRLGQTRSFRFNMWSSYLDPVFKKELQRHIRGSRRKYIETLNRKLLWDGHLPDYARRQLKGLMCTALHRQNQTGRGGRWSDIDDIFGVNEKPQRANEDGIEDVERDAVETLFSSHPKYASPRQTDRLDNYQQSPTERDYEIDPITNRKVFKNPSIKPQTPNSVDDTPEDRLRSIYGRRVDSLLKRQLNMDNQPSNEATETLFSSGGGMHYRSIIFPGPMFPSEVDTSVNSQAPQPKQGGPELQKPIASRKGPFKSTSGPANNSSKPSTFDPVESGLKTYDSKAHYDQPFTAYEPDGQPPSEDLTDPAEEGFKIYDAKVAREKKNHESKLRSTSRPVQGRERFKSARVEKAHEPEAGLDKYDSKASYDKPFMAYEPDGQRSTEEAEDLEQKGYEEYDQKHPYGPVFHNEPDGKPEEQVSRRDENGWDIYDKRHSYGPVYHNEPDGKPEEHITAQDEGGWEIYDKKHSYGPVYHNEPDGKPNEELCNPSKEDGWEVYDEKHPYGPVYHNEPDGKPNEEPRDPNQEDGWEVYDKKHPYGPVYHNEPDGKPNEEPCDPNQEGGWEVYDKEHPYGPVYHNEPDGKPIGISTQPLDPVQEGLREYDSRINYSPRLRSVINHDRERKGRSVVGSTFKNGQFTHAMIRAMRGATLEKEFGKAHDWWNGTLKEGSGATQKLSDKKTVPEESVLETSIPAQSSKITGNFVRDFPEEFQTTWSKGKSESLVPKVEPNKTPLESRIQNAEKAYIDGLAPSDSFCRQPDTPRLQPSLDRSSPKTGATTSEEASSEDQFLSSSTPMIQGEGDLSESISSYGRTSPETSEGNTEEVAMSSLSAEDSEVERLRHEIQNIYDDSMSSLQSGSSEKPVPKNTNQQPTLYKILVYDPESQSIDVAETTSIVTDSSAPPTPDEVLLKLSNPAKFFPHFPPLESQGYEIVSGSGNVLIFRKVRDGPSTGITGEPLATTQDRARLFTNPIDGMQSTPIATTGNFASPTGFVNHDLPTEPSSKPESIPDDDFQLPINNRGLSERHEEFLRHNESIWQKLSVRRDHERAQRKRTARQRKAKRFVLISTGFAGVAYVVGVVQEYFKTGGIDGVGPQGF